MATENEPAKLLLPYLQRADELQKHEPLVAYYCRLYAMERGLKIPSSERTKTTNSLLVSLMKQLEKDKKSLQLGPEDNLHLEGFALNVFAKADKQDRAGRADLNSAKTFYAASIFFEILNQFGPLQPDIEEKQKYAAWKAADIRKAVKEGRKPNPGPPTSEEDLSTLKSTSSGSYDLGPSGLPVSGSPRLQPDSSSEFHDSVNSNGNTPPSSRSQDTIDNPFSTNIPPSTQNYPSASYPSHDLQQPPPNPPRDFHPPSRDPSHDFHLPPPMDLSHDFHQPPPMDPSHDFHRPPPMDSHDFHPPPPPNRPDSSAYSQPYMHQPYPQDPQHMPPNHPTQEAPSFSYPNFQTYPSFNETSLPSEPSHYPSHYQDTSYSPQSAPPTATAGNNNTETSQYLSSGRSGASEPMAPPAQKFEYDSNYQPSPEKIAEAHKAARFAVGALAFDDVSIAVDFLKKSLELLTNPSASH